MQDLLLVAIEVGKLYSGSQRNTPLIHQLENIGDTVCETDITLNLRFAIWGVIRDSLYGELLTNLVRSSFT